ncbi:2-C-methyl-D-erythritol 4-phosphate cytidylyltransferase [Pasteurellaceae bacterium HPA106]|uniref:2-C-methyl-D-erythritol 4-phosphate cytidylyltransferase n=1 Tax=Spirabiliibacterium pneumoniae TaxID=221400 RepID=UPI001AACE017|nr:2-C-methyl-D-erythritol 4-phosphate cytidylyltransferase [Spirabiliibacterium pneumoniae]MBE2897149.1 2-C-methyl-D-erythritol 4-phosphate cytidylyltransferase [Spirabiliibacterium pneumoniae]
MARRIVAIVPAAGVGSRMGASVPKQYLTLGDKTVLEHTVSLLARHRTIDEIVIAVAENDHWIARLKPHFDTKVRCVIGGVSRAQSVYNALCTLDQAAWALVHDGARACLHLSDIDKLLEIDSPEGAILACPVTDTLKLADKHTRIQHTVDRTLLWQALTPQFFPVSALRAGYEYAFDKQLEVTDDASAVELIGLQPHLVEGRRDNIKITRPEDLALAEFYLQRRDM